MVSKSPATQLLIIDFLTWERGPNLKRHLNYAFLSWGKERENVSPLFTYEGEGVKIRKRDLG